MDSRWSGIQRAGAVALPVLSLGFLLLSGGMSDDISFISQAGSAPWIAPPMRVSAELQQWGSEEAPIASYLRRFDVEASQGSVHLTLRALRRFAITLNDTPVPGASSEGMHWREPIRVELPVRRGQNELRIDVSNRHGPPLLSLHIDGLNGVFEPVLSDTSWAVDLDGRPLGRAVIADDTRINPLSLSLATPVEQLIVRRDSLALIFVLGVFGALGARRWGSERLRAALPASVLGLAALGWGYLFFEKFTSISPAIGFDARHHLGYVDFLLERGAVPLATDGWSVYHPPLFYAAAGVARWLGGVLAGDGGATAALKLIPFLAGFGNVWIAGALCRRLFPGSCANRALAVLFAAVLPVNLYCAAYFSNETFHTFLAGLAVLVTVDLLLQPAVRAQTVARLAVILGLAAITKFTALLVAGVAGFFLFFKLVAVDRAPLRHAAALMGVVAAAILAIAGWFYLRNWVHFGDPFVANWGYLPGPALAWWQQPGFHTLPYFTHFGESLRHPYHSAFYSFWDSLYSTFWGDGGIAGRVSPLDRPPFWNYSFMSLGYLLALPATALLVLGAARAVGVALFDDDPRRRAVFSFLTTLVYAVVFSLLYLALRFPYAAQGKASYGLVVSAPLAVFFAMGVETVDSALSRSHGRWLRGRHSRWLRPLFFGWLAVFSAALLFSFAG